MERFESLTVAGGSVVLVDGRPVACGEDRHKALERYERLRLCGMPYPPIPWLVRDGEGKIVDA